MNSKIKRVIETSKQVIRDCALENGALVAANPTKEYYSREAKHYFYVWPRDGAFTCMAADTIGIHDIQEPFFDWILNRAEGVDDNGLLNEKYYVNGLQALGRFQPDQGGALLMAMEKHFAIMPDSKAKYKELVLKLARGLSEVWEGDHFKIMTNDLWEERNTYPDLAENFSYSLAICARGLLSANQLYPEKKFAQVAKEMQQTLLKSTTENGNFYRSFGLLSDKRVDASLLGNIWPGEVVPFSSELATNTVNLIQEKLVVDNGLYRYEHDEYDGWMVKGNHRKKGAGYWPLLNCWLAITLSKMGRRQEAMQYFDKVLADIDEKSGLIPEQVFTNNIQKAVSPLCWSHSMFILAAEELGLLKD